MDRWFPILDLDPVAGVACGEPACCIIRSVIRNLFVTNRATLIYIRGDVRFHMASMHAMANTKPSTLGAIATRATLLLAC